MIDNLYNEQNPIKIVLADDHDVVRVGLKRLIAIDKSIKIIDEANNGEDAYELILYHKPHIAILDIMMPKLTGIEVTKLVKQNLPDTFVIMLTAFEDAAHLELALAAGADGYLTKDTPAKEIINAIRSVLSGERVFSKSIVLLVQNKFMNRASQVEPHIKITRREQEILNLVAEGKTSNEIADALFLSIRTVESHRYNIMQKLGIKNTAALIRFAVMNSGIIS